MEKTDLSANLRLHYAQKAITFTHSLILLIGRLLSTSSSDSCAPFRLSPPATTPLKSFLGSGGPNSSSSEDARHFPLLLLSSTNGNPKRGTPALKDCISSSCARLGRSDTPSGISYAQAGSGVESGEGRALLLPLDAPTLTVYPLGRVRGGVLGSPIAPSSMRSSAVCLTGASLGRESVSPNSSEKSVFAWIKSSGHSRQHGQAS